MHRQPDRLEELLDRARFLPLSADGAIEGIVAACDDPRSSMHDIAGRIELEPGVAAVVLRQANSAHYGYGRRVETIPDAAVVLGIGTIRSLAIASAVLKLLAVDRDGLSQHRQQILQHSVATAITARVLARRQGTTHPEKAFLTGIIHELGTIVLSRETKPEYLHVVSKARTARRSISDVEREVYGFEHAQLGARLAEAWQFPAPICEALLTQHDPERARMDRGLCDTLHVADWLAADMGLGFVPFDHPSWPVKRAADTFGLSPHNLHEVKAEIQQGLGGFSLAA
jgi:HD-like signal output (HDOD) protein